MPMKKVCPRCGAIFYRVIAQLSDWMLCNAPI